MKPLVRWMRWILPRSDILSVAVGGVVLIESIYLFCLFYDWGPDAEEFAKIRLSFLAMCSLSYGVLRAVWFHPVLHVDYRRWLELTPWTPGRVLPAGPLTLVPQDLIVMLILIGLHHELTPLLLILPCTFLFGYVTAMAVIHRLIGEWALAYAVAFGLAAIPMLHKHLEYVLAVEIVCYLLTAWGVQRGLNSFPWTLPEMLESRSFKSTAEAVKDRRLGWPYDALKFDPPKLTIPIADGIFLSLLAGWLEVSILAALNHLDRVAVIGGVGMFLGTSPVFIIAGCVENHRSPISFWGRMITLRWIIPSFDRIWIVPVMAGGAALTAHILLPLYWNALALSGYLLVVLVLGPHLERWRLTGKHRLTFGWNTAAMGARDFIEI